MRPFLIASGVAVLLLFVSTPMSAAPEEQKDNSPKPTAAIPVYSESEDGLKNLIGDIFGAMKSGQKDLAASYFASLEIPDRVAWFTKAFGPVEGPRLEAKYEALFQQPNGNVRAHFEYALKDGRTNADVHVLREPATNPGMIHAIFDAMVQPLLLFSASGTSPTQQYAASIGDFVYVDGKFRFIDPQIFQALSTAPPLRIRVGGNVQVAKILHKVSPIYPSDAKAAHIQGSVGFHVVIGTDGKVKDMETVSGNPSLAQAASDALRQWQYQPTLLNGAPVEVDTTVTMDFKL